MDVKLPPDQIAVLERLAAAIEHLAAAYEAVAKGDANGKA